ncbi:hypothetical protein C1H46_018738 [Malus baccata]|uniref:Uncharacterized protein n=1 Tax=Malus baccata TaxID=106549 RepID=A0A540MA17_MALBA|nr:hypothetical protein C1H46_018738 [Malus baccata]
MREEEKDGKGKGGREEPGKGFRVEEEEVDVGRGMGKGDERGGKRWKRQRRKKEGSGLLPTSNKRKGGWLKLETEDRARGYGERSKERER